MAMHRNKVETYFVWLHNPGEFFYSSVKLFNYQYELVTKPLITKENKTYVTFFDINTKRIQAMNVQNDPCYENEAMRKVGNVDFCVTNAFQEKMRCQFPWKQQNGVKYPLTNHRKNN